MNLDLILTIKEDAGLLYRLFLPETGTRKRSEFSLDLKEGALDMKIKASDPIALKAQINSVIRLLEIYEKMQVKLNV